MESSVGELEERSGAGSRSRAYFHVDMGAFVEDRGHLHTFLLSLAERKVARIQKLAFLVVSKAGEVEIVHSLFGYDGSPEL